MFSKYLAFATILLFLGVGIKPAIATVLPDEKMEVEYYEMDGNREQVPQNGFCILLVYAWGLTEWLVPVPAPFFPLIYKDLDTGKTRLGITGLFGNKFFIGLKIGHTYKITELYRGRDVVIELTDFWNYVELYVGYFWYK